MKLMTLSIKFTPTEFEIIEDRLFGAPDAIAEIMAEEGFDPSIVEDIKVYDRTGTSITLMLPRKSIPALVDCLEGSTYLYKSSDAAGDGQITRGRLISLRRAAKSAVDKLNKLGIECGEVPC